MTKSRKDSNRNGPANPGFQLKSSEETLDQDLGQDLDKDLDKGLGQDSGQDLDLELAGLPGLLRKYSVPVPNEAAVDATIQELRQYVPAKRNFYRMQWENFTGIVRLSALDLDYMSKSYWLISAAIFILGYIIITGTVHNPYLCLIALAPMPFILGMIEVFKGREQGVLEIELSCRITPQQVMLSKLLLIGLYNIALNTVLSVALSLFHPGLILWQITLSWLTPLAVVSSLTLWLAQHIRGGYAVTAVLGLWLSATLSLSTQPMVADRLMHLNLMIYGLAIMISALWLGIQLKKMMSRYSYERSGIYEFDY
ncbi:hypothetical protein CEB3_c12370 [Peptococcaceae bacterium CEB3]|nr:hypothetical protein CEB3_c12370 [Peptococcaceae bacterium CEB3]